jgi:hypothetical protein
MPDRTFGCRAALLVRCEVRMASKRSHRGRRVGPPRLEYFPWEEDRRLRRESELAREAKRWDEDRIKRFEEDLRRKREWMRCY